jgi:hypothetical protein
VGILADVFRWSARLEESRTHEFDERLTVTDDEPMVTELRLARGGRVRYDCEVLDGKPVVVGLIEDVELDRVEVGVRSAPEFVAGTRSRLGSGETVSESVSVPGGTYHVATMVAPDAVGGAGPVEGSVVELSGTARVTLTDTVRQSLS